MISDQLYIFFIIIIFFFFFWFSQLYICNFVFASLFLQVFQNNIANIAPLSMIISLLLLSYSYLVLQAAWLLRAVTCIDLTTLSGDDTQANVNRLCFKAKHPVMPDLLKAMDVQDLGSVIFVQLVRKSVFCASKTRSV